MSNDKKVEIGANIRKFRTEKGYSVRKLAHESDISSAYISEVERGLSEISSEKLSRIADALGMSVQSLISNEPEVTSKEEITFPPALSEVAEELDLSFTDTKKIFLGATSLRARRSTGQQSEWSKEQWVEFYKKVQSFLKE